MNNTLILESCKRMIDFGCYNRYISKYYKELTGNDIEEQYSEDEISKENKVKYMENLFAISRSIKLAVILGILLYIEFLFCALDTITITEYKVVGIITIAFTCVVGVWYILYYGTKLGVKISNKFPVRLNNSMKEYIIDFYVTNGYVKVNNNEHE